MSQVNQTSPETEVLRELLKRCPKGTFEAALAFRAHKDVAQVPVIVLGIIERHLEPEQKEILGEGNDSIRLSTSSTVPLASLIPSSAGSTRDNTCGDSS